MAVQQTIWLYEGDGRQSAIINGGEEIRCVLDVFGALHRVTHNGVSVGFEVANVAVGRPDQYGRIGRSPTLLLNLRQLHGGVVCSAIIGPGNALLIQRFTNRTDIGRRNGAALCDSGRVYGAVGQKARVVVVDHVKVIGLAVRFWIVRQRFQVIPDWLDSWLVRVGALGEIAVEIDVHRVLVV